MKDNPFVLPGFGQSGPAAQNPILASMEMMRQAWEGLAKTSGMDPAAMGQVMSVEELDKRITDLRAVENWLRMNLSMLSSTIQGLEVQRATVATLQSFVETGMAMAQPAQEAKAEPSKPAHESRAEPPKSAEPSAPGGTPEAGDPADQGDVMSAAATAAQGWWNMLQQQFQTLAAATAASAEEAMSGLAEAAAQAGHDTTPSPKSPATGAAKKSASKKTAVKKTSAKKAAAGKATKAARKTPASRKTTR